MHDRYGPAAGAGLGFYAFQRFHIDTRSFRRWGSAGPHGNESPCDVLERGGDPEAPPLPPPVPAPPGRCRQLSPFRRRSTSPRPRRRRRQARTSRNRHGARLELSNLGIFEACPDCKACPGEGRGRMCTPTRGMVDDIPYPMQLDESWRVVDFDEEVVGHA